jgi:AcrR family transcriptional regulator
MDDIAAAAGVGKGTLFRAFGSRDGLLDALFAAQLAPWKAELERTGSPLGPGRPAADRVEEVIRQLLSFKLKNGPLLAAREQNGSNLLAAPHYVWMHTVLRDLLVQTSSTLATADYFAHILLGALRVEVINATINAGATPESIEENLIAIARRGPGRESHSP